MFDSMYWYWNVYGDIYNIINIGDGKEAITAKKQHQRCNNIVGLVRPPNEIKCTYTANNK